MEWQFREKSGPVISCIPVLESVPQSEDAIPPFLENIPSPHLISWVVRKKRYRTIGRVGGRRIISFRRQLVALFFSLFCFCWWNNMKRAKQILLL